MISKLRDAIFDLRHVPWVALALSLAVVGCGSPATLPPPTSMPQPTATQMVAAPTPTVTPELGPVDFNLTIVQTNDTWGYLDPCG